MHILWTTFHSNPSTEPEGALWLKVTPALQTFSYGPANGSARFGIASISACVLSFVFGFMVAAWGADLTRHGADWNGVVDRSVEYYFTCLSLVLVKVPHSGAVKPSMHSLTLSLLFCIQHFFFPSSYCSSCISKINSKWCLLSCCIMLPMQHLMTLKSVACISVQERIRIRASFEPW